MEELLALPVSFGIKTVAAALGLGSAKAYEYAAAGEIPAVTRLSRSASTARSTG